MAKRSQATVQENGEVGRIRSTYKKQRSPQTDVKSFAVSCKHCGEHAHRNRRLECPAFNHLCTCGRRGHLPKVCFNKGKPRSAPFEKQEAISGDSLYELATRYAIAPERGYIDGIMRPRGNRLPVTVSVDVPNVPALRDRHTTPTEHVTSCPAVADTGATVTCSGPDILATLGVQRRDLLPTDIRLFAVNKSRLQVLGVLPVTISLTSDDRHQQLPEMLYIVKELSGMYLSKDILITLGSIPPSFPYPPSPRLENTPTADVHSVTTSKTDPGDTELAPCGCPVRTVAPDPPPFPEGTSEADVPQLRELLVAH